MKIISLKNGLKYFAGTLALTGMLLTTGCNNNERETATEDPTQVRGEENQVGQPTRDNLSRENVNTEINEGEAEEGAEDANRIIDERQETQQRGNIERANPDTLEQQNQQHNRRGNQAGDTTGH
jgi:hypothetical protein